MSKVKYDSTAVTLNLLKEAHGRLLKRIRRKMPQGNAVGVAMEVTNYGDPFKLQVEFCVTVFYPEYRTYGPEGQRTCESLSGPDFNKLMKEAMEIVRKEYK